MTIQERIEELFQDVLNSFEDDGMTVKMPENVQKELKDEMANRLCDAMNEIRDDIEKDVRAFAIMNDEEEIAS